MRFVKKYLFILLCGFGLQAFGQKNLSEEVNVIRAYKPILAEAVKINQNPEIKFEEQGKNNPEYNFLSHRIDSTLRLSKVNTEKMKNESIAKLYRSYIRVGGGNYRSSYAEAWLNNLRSKDWAVGAHLYHRAAVGTVENMDYSANQVDLHAKKIMAENTLSMSLLYDRDVTHFYGYDHDLFDVNARSVRQQFDYVGFHSALQSNNRDPKSKWVYEGVFDFYNTSDFYQAKENRFSMGASLGFKEYQGKIGLDIANASDSLEQANHLFFIEPSIHLEEYGVQFELGVNAYQEFGDRQKFRLYPVIRANYKISDWDAEAFAGIDGKLRKNSFRSMYVQNPWIGAKQIIENTNEKLHVYAGIRGKLDVKNAYVLNIEHYNLGNELYFVTDSSFENKFKVIYDGNSASQTNFNIDFSHQSNNKLRLLAGFTYSLFNTDTLREAYNRPRNVVRLGADYNIANKFLIEAQLYSYSGMKALDSDGTIKDLQGGVDLNLGVDYRYSKIISVYLDLNNMLNYKREQYLHYSGYGFQAMLGASFRF